MQRKNLNEYKLKLNLRGRFCPRLALKTFFGSESE
jgi:hypothetical protein